MSRRVGVLTFHWAPHIGAHLQTYALYNVLANYFSTTIVNFIPKLSDLVRRLPSLRGCVIKHYYLLNRRHLIPALKSSVGEIFNYAFYVNIEKRKNVAYRHNLLVVRLSKPITTLEELKSFCEQFDVIVVGSDQVWNPSFLRHSDYAYLLPFKLRSAQKVAYAASIGVNDLDSIDQKILIKCKTCLSDFSDISLRERAHIPFISKLVGKEVKHALDPTLLITSDHWISKASPLKEGMALKRGEYFFIYNLNYDIMLMLDHVLDRLRRDFDVIAYSVPRIFPLQSARKLLHFIGLYSKGVKFLEFIDLFEFLWLVRNAKCVITDSYHGTIFSVIFKKNFVSIPPKGKSVRILDLLGLLGLKDRVAYTSNGVLQRLNNEIDYSHVEEKLDFYRRRSLEFLLSAIKS